MQKKSIAIYQPEDSWEQAIQTAYHARNEDWLPSFACQLAAKAVAQFLNARGDFIKLYRFLSAVSF